jgi:hypothetical protein
MTTPSFSNGRSSHPLPIGTRIRTLVPQVADNADGDEVACPAGTVGEVISVTDLGEAGGWSYGVDFGPWVYIDQRDGIDDPAKYEILPPLIKVLHDALVKVTAVLQQLNDTMPGQGEMQNIMVQGYTGHALAVANDALVAYHREIKERSSDGD